MKLPVYKIDGTTSGPLDINEALFTLPWNNSLVHQAVTVAQKNERIAIAHTKNRGEVSGGGKKPWPQKYTGRARHGSIRSPIWVGGGTTFGPRSERSYKRVANQKMRARALFIVLSKKLRDGELFFTEDIQLQSPKTKEVNVIFKSFLKSVNKDFNNEKVLVIANESSAKGLKQSARNIPFIRVMDPSSASALLLLRHKYIMLPRSSAIKLVELRGGTVKTKVSSKK